MKKIVRPLLVLFFVLTLLTGIVYPVVVTGLGQWLFPKQANGSLVQRDGKTVGSLLVGQNFTAPGYFWGRPSATGPFPNNAAVSSGSNQGPLNPALVDAVKGRVEALRAADPTNTTPVPNELVNTSASGIDPHISPAAAQFQVARVAKARNLAVDNVQALVTQNTTHPFLGVIGEPVVNVLQLNLALDSLR